MQKRRTVSAYAKINLALNVRGRRDDGYHELAMVMHPITIADKLEIELADRFDFEVVSDDSNVGPLHENTIMKAAGLLESCTGRSINLSVRLTKAIPIAAGMGGGSSDAAAFLLAANGLLELGLSFEELSRIGLKIGADVPFCMMGQAGLSAVAEGIGERLRPVEITKEFHFVVANPGRGLSTAEVYRALKEPFADRRRDVESVVRALEDGNSQNMARSIFNDLEPQALRMMPEIDGLMEHLMRAGCLRAFVTGSGPTVIGLVPNRSAAEQVHHRLEGRVPYLEIARSLTPHG